VVANSRTHRRDSSHSGCKPVLLGALLAGFALDLFAVETGWAPLHRLDGDAAASFHDFGRQHPTGTAFWRYMSDVLHPDVLRVVAVLAAIALWRAGRRAIAALVLSAMAGAWLLEVVTKWAVGRPRPPLAQQLGHASGASFPSGHAMTSIVAFGLLVMLVPSRFRLAALAVGAVAVVLVGISRLALVVHYPTDVVGGWLLGAAWLVAARWLSGCAPVARRVRDRPRGR
jgi:undecaprenyl-diphosphatase